MDDPRLQRATDRLCASRSANAIDLLIASLTKVLAQPHNERFRTVNPAHPAMRPVADSRGGTEFLWAVGYEPIHGHLVLQRHDPERLRAGLAALQRAKATEEIKEAGQRLQEERARAVASKAQREREDAARSTYRAKVPEEPPEGEAGTSLLCFHIAGKYVWRRFESCNTVEDALNFVRSLPAVDPNATLLLKNVTQAPAVPLTSDVSGYTLQRLDMWPSAQVAVEVAS